MKPWGNFWCDLCDVGAESVPPGWNRVKVTENLDATDVVPDAPVDTSLHLEASPYVTTSLRISWTRFLYDGWCYRCIKQKQLRLLLLVASVQSHRNVRVLV